MSMKITITATEKTTTMDGVPVRLWSGVTEDGTPCQVFVHRIAVEAKEDCSRFDRELQEKLPPGRHLPLSMIL
jgi:hypothetical protein